MPFFSLRWSTSNQSCSAAISSAIVPGPSGGPSPTTRVGGPREPVCPGGDLIGDRAGAVGGAIVDHEDAKALRRRAREHVGRGGHDRRYVLSLVVRRQYQPRLSGHRSAYPRPCRRSPPVAGRRLAVRGPTLVPWPSPSP